MAPYPVVKQDKTGLDARHIYSFTIDIIEYQKSIKLLKNIEILIILSIFLLNYVIPFASELTIKK